MKKRLPPEVGESKLRGVVRRWLNQQGNEYDNGWRGALSDLREGGCISGIVSNLVYYHDTLRFYRRHRAEIASMLAAILKDSSFKGPGELFAEWDADDPLARDTHNRNLLAWFGFEEMANQIAADQGV